MRNLIMILLISISLKESYALLAGEALRDPVLEARARSLSLILRCVVCENQTIDDSNADMARDLRLLIRERILSGDTDQKIVDFLVERYGEFILMKPRFNWQNSFLWGGPFLFLMGGIFYILNYIFKKQN